MGVKNEKIVRITPITICFKREKIQPRGWISFLLLSLTKRRKGFWWLFFEPENVVEYDAADQI